MHLYTKIKETDFFDAEYYSHHYMYKLSNYDEALKHYFTFGRYLPYNPSKKFCTSLYLSHNLDVAKDSILNGNHPGGHYVLYGKNEKRKIYPVIENENSFIGEYVDINYADIKVAIILHLFYEEYIPIISNILSTYHFKFDIYITSSSHEILKKAVPYLKSTCPGSKIISKRTPNIGRNFAPFLVEYSKFLLKYDIIGHIHTKKSLYTGTPRYDWAMNSISGVIGSPEYVHFVFNKLMTKECGLVCSDKGNDIPFWCYHWLKNFSFGSKLASKLNIEINESFLNYPVGGMFWARTDAIKQILLNKWEYNQFDSEKGQIDGTLHHAIERIIGACCTYNNYKILKWDNLSGTFNNDQSPWRKEILTKSKKKIKELIKQYDIISFDIFDTLIYRNCLFPEDVRDRLDIYIKDYKNIRKDAEIKARQSLSPDKDVTILDIAQHISFLLNLPLEKTLQILSNELYVDLSSMYPRNTMISLVDYAISLNKRIIYVSDMYYRSSEIYSILNKLNIPIPHQIYISSEVGLRKDTGTLWNHVREFEAGSILHFGDNVVSDLQNSCDFGINSVYVIPIKDKLNLIGMLKTNNINKNQWDLLFPIIKEFGEDPFFG